MSTRENELPKEKRQKKNTCGGRDSNFVATYIIGLLSFDRYLTSSILLISLPLFLLFIPLLCIELSATLSNMSPSFAGSLWGWLLWSIVPAITLGISILFVCAWPL